MKSKLRIIGGQWRSRQIHFVDTPGLRPTPNRLRETLFNWLQFDLINSRCLDLFAGSGVLGLEAGSRGAKRVVQVEYNLLAYQCLVANKASLAAEFVDIYRQDVELYLQQAPECFDLVFMDPPFAQNLVSPTCQLLEQQAWLADSAKIYIETERNLQLTDLPMNWRLIKNQAAGQVAVYLFERWHNS